MMDTTEGIGSAFSYGRKLVGAGIDGIREGTAAALSGQSIRSVTSDTASRSICIALAGACLGIVGASLAGPKRLRDKVAYGALGGSGISCWGSLEHKEPDVDRCSRRTQANKER